MAYAAGMNVHADEPPEGPAEGPVQHDVAEGPVQHDVAEGPVQHDVADGTIEVVAPRKTLSPEGHATGAITHKDVDRELPRSLPDALQVIPGLWIQQTSHGQASPFIRGVTGQRVLILVDGLRLNHTLFRQGPNQYLFTVDSQSIDRVEVVRGSASTELGADALGGAILIRPRDPKLDPHRDEVIWHPRLRFRHATADQDTGGRVESDLQLNDSTAVLLGVGYREVGLLEASGPVHGDGGREPQSPCFEVDGEVRCVGVEGQAPPDLGPRRLQHGTGFDELTADLRAVHRLDADTRLTAAAYVYREFDAPRTDLCPPPEAPSEECFTYTEQFRTQAYAKLEAGPKLAALNRLQLAAGYQRFHDRYSLDRPRSSVRLGGRDDVDMWEASLFALSSRHTMGPLALEVRYGASLTYEAVSSAAWTQFTSNDSLFFGSRGIYVDGSSSKHGGVFVAPTLDLGRDLTLRTGTRLHHARADSPAETESGTTAVHQSFTSLVGNAGLEWRFVSPLAASVNVEQGFRPPNLDDLTSRQATGRGYQLENPDLRAETALTIEAGLHLRTRRTTAAIWAYQMRLTDTMERARADCPTSDFECRANRAPLQLVNLDGVSTIEGVDAEVMVKLPYDLTVRAFLSRTVGEGQNPVEGPGEAKRVPLSRIPPLNGHLDLGFEHAESGVYAGARYAYADEQARLSPSDRTDVRIPFGGTPGYHQVKLRAGLRIPADFALGLVMENVFDSSYRVHGSGVNGSARGLMLNMEVMR